MNRAVNWNLPMGKLNPLAAACALAVKDVTGVAVDDESSLEARVSSRALRARDLTSRWAASGMPSRLPSTKGLGEVGQVTRVRVKQDMSVELHWASCVLRIEGRESR